MENKPLKPGDDFTEGKSFLQWLFSGQRLGLVAAIAFFVAVFIYSLAVSDDYIDSLGRRVGAIGSMIMAIVVLLLAKYNYHDAKNGKAK